MVKGSKSERVLSKERECFLIGVKGEKKFGVIEHFVNSSMLQKTCGQFSILRLFLVGEDLPRVIVPNSRIWEEIFFSNYRSMLFIMSYWRFEFNGTSHNMLENLSKFTYKNEINFYHILGKKQVNHSRFDKFWETRSLIPLTRAIMH